MRIFGVIPFFKLQNLNLNLKQQLNDENEMQN